jgi:hypothetical protein
LRFCVFFVSFCFHACFHFVSRQRFFLIGTASVSCRTPFSLALTIALLNLDSLPPAAENTNTRVAIFTVLESALLITIATLQLLFVRAWFSDNGNEIRRPGRV